MTLSRLVLSLLLSPALLAGGLPDSRLSIHVVADRSDAPCRLRGEGDRRQVVVTLDAGTPADVTRAVDYRVEPAGVIEVDAEGWVRPVGNGAASLRAVHPSGESALHDFVVEEFEREQPVHFANQIVPVFTKAGCNGGGCHGKSGGQNGFRLSLLGFEPAEDYEYLVLESRGRRVFPAAPDHSLLLRKATGELPHGGGRRLERDSMDYDLVRRWIRQGMPFGSPEDPVVESIEVFPRHRVMGRGAGQQLAVMAVYTDGSRKDVTRSALFEANVEDLAEVGENGWVQLQDKPGEVAVMVRYQSRVAVFRATIPLGSLVDSLPEPVNLIDEHIFAKLEQVGMPPSAPADDAVFLRRAALDIAGRLPTASEAREFLESGDPDRRSRWIDRMLEDPGYSALFANKWSALLRNSRSNANEKRRTYLFHDWIRDSLRTNLPYDRFVGAIIGAAGDMEHHPPVAWYRQVRAQNEMVEDMAQLFLGVRLQCAQCHHHPFERWSQHDYYSLAAFFSRVGRRAGAGSSGEMVHHNPGRALARNPRTGENLPPAALGAPALSLPDADDPRVHLVEWMTRRDNPFFARSLVNRYWKHFFGRGLVDPEDDMRLTNPPTHPALLDDLAHRFVDSGHDVKELVRTICRSRTYQLSAIPNEHNVVDRQFFSRYYPRRLLAETLYDSVHDMLGSRVAFADLPPDVRALELPDNSFNKDHYFLSVFGRPESSSSCECERSTDASLAQSLHLLNSKSLQDRLAADDGRAARLAAETGRSHEERIGSLYLMALSRYPDAGELRLAMAYLEEKGGEPATGGGDPVRMAYEDIIWALINTKEFLFNH